MSNAAYGHIDMHKCRLRMFKDTSTCAHMLHEPFYIFGINNLWYIYIYVKIDYIEIFFEPIVLKNGRYSDD